MDSKYRLVHIVARRSKEMFRTHHYQLDEKDYVSSKNIGRALEEIAEKKIILKSTNDEN